MAIEFGRSEMISRGKGGTAVRSAAYARRERLYDERTGLTYNFTDDGTLEHSSILLPEDADRKYLNAGTLFNAIEWAEVRKDAQTGRAVVVALDNSISPAERAEMAEGFARQIFVERGYPVLVCVHSPHDGGNHHAHLIGGTRQLRADGFAAHKIREVSFTRPFGRPIGPQAERVGELWRDFQNTWFSANGKGISVDPVAPIPQAHIGPMRFRHPQDHRVATNNQIRESNAKLARDPAAVAEHLGQRPFNGQELHRFLAKHITDPEERKTVAGEAQEKIRELQRDALERASWADKTQSGLRKLTIEDVARELSPRYARYLKEAKELKRQADGTDWSRNRLDIEKERADYRVGERWGEMGLARRAAHLVGTKVPALGSLRDIELERWTNESGRGDYTIKKWSIRQQAILGKLDVATRLAEAEFEKVRPQAQAELHRRQTIALNARETLDKMTHDAKLMAQARRTYNRAAHL